MDTITITETGCVLDNHRGHYISRDAIEVATGYGFIIGSFEQFAVAMYQDHNCDEEYPSEALAELCEEAVNWLNSGQDVCDNCTDGLNPKDGDYWTHKDDPTNTPRCKKCTGTGRGDRMAGQNFPPILPDGYYWAFNDGDFGIYTEEELD